MFGQMTDISIKTKFPDFPKFPEKVPQEEELRILYKHTVLAPITVTQAKRARPYGMSHNSPPLLVQWCEDPGTPAPTP